MKGDDIQWILGKLSKKHMRVVTAQKGQTNKKYIFPATTKRQRVILKLEQSIITAMSKQIQLNTSTHKDFSSTLNISNNNSRFNMYYP